MDPPVLHPAIRTRPARYADLWHGVEYGRSGQPGLDPRHPDRGSHRLPRLRAGKLRTRGSRRAGRRTHARAGARAHRAGRSAGRSQPGRYGERAPGVERLQVRLGRRSQAETPAGLVAAGLAGRAQSPSGRCVRKSVNKVAAPVTPITSAASSGRNVGVWT